MDGVQEIIHLKGAQAEYIKIETDSSVVLLLVNNQHNLAFHRSLLDKVMRKSSLG